MRNVVQWVQGLDGNFSRAVCALRDIHNSPKFQKGTVL